MQTPTAVVVAGAMIAAAILVAATLMPGRFQVPIGVGASYTLIDTRTGEVSECAQLPDEHHCEETAGALNAWLEEQRPVPQVAQRPAPRAGQQPAQQADQQQREQSGQGFRGIRCRLNPNAPNCAP